MSDIKIEHNPSEDRLQELGVFDWAIWTKEASEFPWHYDARETCYLLEGKVDVTPEGGDTVRFGKSDLVILPQGMSCTWKIHEDVKKHYRFD